MAKNRFISIIVPMRTSKMKKMETYFPLALMQLNMIALQPSPIRTSKIVSNEPLKESKFSRGDSPSSRSTFPSASNLTYPANVLIPTRAKIYMKKKRRRAYDHISLIVKAIESKRSLNSPILKSLKILKTLKVLKTKKTLLWLIPNCFRTI